MSYVYETVKGYFLQDDGFDGTSAILPGFGLKIEGSAKWKALLEALDNMNASASTDVAYKLIFAARHGQAYHNLAELKYGTQVWNEQWASKDGDDDITWGPDPCLTELGEQQARYANSAWNAEVTLGMPLPEKLYCSPMTRAMRTCEVTFDGVVDFAERPPLILENCREIYGLNSCDKRSSLSRIRSTFPAFAVEDGFTEVDELHDPNARETYEHVVERARLVLNYIFSRDKETVISITAHSRFIKSLVIAANHETVELPTGGILPLIVKGTKRAEYSSIS